MLAYEDKDKGRKDENEDVEAADVEGPADRLRRVWARYDSRPELKAKDPKGKAESESRRR